MPRNIKEVRRGKIDIQGQKLEAKVDHQEEQGTAMPSKEPQVMPHQMPGHGGRAAAKSPNE